MTERQKGVAALIVACTIWGLSPIYYKALAGVAPLEVLSHRTLWSVVVFGLVLAWQRRLAEVWPLLRGREAGIVLLGALMISVNWYVFIRSIQLGQAVEASLGYYIFPLVAVVIGVLAFGERLSPWQAGAIALAGLAVGVLTWGLGVAPWVALLLAVTFGIYGMIKKRLSAGPVVAVTAEVVLLAPLAVLWLISLHSGFGAGWIPADATSPGGHFGTGLSVSLLLAFAGLLTAVPLMLFSYAARRVTMATFGLTQFLNPTLQFLCATLLFREPFSPWHMLAFALIWVAVLLYSAETLRRARVSRLPSNVGTSASTLT